MAINLGEHQMLRRPEAAENNRRQFCGKDVAERQPFKSKTRFAGIEKEANSAESVPSCHDGEMAGVARSAGLPHGWHGQNMAAFLSMATPLSQGCKTDG